MMNGKIILTSFGMHTKLGYRKIAQSLSKEECEGATILLIVLPKHDLDEELIFWCQALGFGRDDITVFHSDEAEHIKQQYFDVIYVSEGNTFEMLDYIKKNDLMKFIKESVYQGTCYIGASAGAHIAGMDVEEALAFEENDIGMTDFKALGLFHGIAIPHFEYGDRARYEVYKRAHESGKYAYVATIGNDEVEVMEAPFQEAVRERAKALAEEEAEYQKIGQEIAEEEDKFQRVPWKTEDGETKYVPLLSVVPFKGKEYAVLLLTDEEGKDEIEITYVEKNEKNFDQLVSINNPLDKFAIERYVARMIGMEALPLRVPSEVK